MSDRNLSAMHVIATALWCSGLLLIVIDLLDVADLDSLAAVTVAAGAVLNVRGFLCHMEQRTERAFDVGREVGRDEVSQLTRR